MRILTPRNSQVLTSEGFVSVGSLQAGGASPSNLILFSESGSHKVTPLRRTDGVSTGQAVILTTSDHLSCTLDTKRRIPVALLGEEEGAGVMTALDAAKAVAKYRIRTFVPSPDLPCVDKALKLLADYIPKCSVEGNGRLSLGGTPRNPTLDWAEVLSVRDAIHILGGTALVSSIALDLTTIRSCISFWLPVDWLTKEAGDIKFGQQMPKAIVSVSPFGGVHDFIGLSVSGNEGYLLNSHGFLI
jgi:hypothetical protein